jgi:deazaflavin-dependent oxidoreductase (nitroreductase family)
MDDRIRRALADDLTVDITTTGARTGHPRRIEIWMLHIDGRYFITGTPGPRDWLANLAAHPDFTLHLKQRVQADLPAHATLVTDAETRRDVLTHATATWYRGEVAIDDLVASAPMVEVTFPSP